MRTIRLALIMKQVVFSGTSILGFEVYLTNLGSAFTPARARRGGISWKGGLCAMPCYAI